jgi:hypothetical protein
MINKTDKYSNALGENFSGCLLKYPANKTARRKCEEDWAKRNTDTTELERIRLENEALALQNAASNTGMSAGQIALIGFGSIAALTIMVVVIKKYAK